MALSPASNRRQHEYIDKWVAERRAAVAQAVRCIRGHALGPRRWPAQGDLVVPIAAVRKQVGWKGALYTVRRARFDGGRRSPVVGMFSFCCGCNAPIERGCLYAPRLSCRPLCIDCVELPEEEG